MKALLWFLNLGNCEKVVLSLGLSSTYLSKPRAVLVKQMQFSLVVYETVGDVNVHTGPALPQARCI